MNTARPLGVSVTFIILIMMLKNDSIKRHTLQFNFTFREFSIAKQLPEAKILNETF